LWPGCGLGLGLRGVGSGLDGVRVFGGLGVWRCRVCSCRAGDGSAVVAGCAFWRGMLWRRPAWPVGFVAFAAAVGGGLVWVWACDGRGPCMVALLRSAWLRGVLVWLGRRWGSAPDGFPRALVRGWRDSGVVCGAGQVAVRRSLSHQVWLAAGGRRGFGWPFPMRCADSAPAVSRFGLSRSGGGWWCPSAVGCPGAGPCFGPLVASPVRGAPAGVPCRSSALRAMPAARRSGAVPWGGCPSRRRGAGRESACALALAARECWPRLLSGPACLFSTPATAAGLFLHYPVCLGFPVLPAPLRLLPVLGLCCASPRRRRRSPAPFGPARPRGRACPFEAFSGMTPPHGVTEGGRGGGRFPGRCCPADLRFAPAPAVELFSAGGFLRPFLAPGSVPARLVFCLRGAVYPPPRPALPPVRVAAPPAAQW